MNGKLLGNTEQLLVRYLVPNNSMNTTLNSKILALVKQIGDKNQFTNIKFHFKL